MTGLGRHIIIELTPGQDLARIQTLAYPASSVRLWHRTDQFLVLKISGHKYWSDSLTGQHYGPAEFQVWQIVSVKRYDNGGKEDIEADLVLTFPVKGVTGCVHGWAVRVQRTANQTCRSVT